MSLVMIVGFTCSCSNYDLLPSSVTNTKTIAPSASGVANYSCVTPVT